MIKSQLVKKDEMFGFVGEVEMVANVEDRELQTLQYQLELVSIYEALAKRFQLNDTIGIITESVQMFLETHK